MKKKNTRKMYVLIFLSIGFLGSIFYYLGNGKIFKKCPSFFEYKSHGEYKSINCQPALDKKQKTYCSQDYRDWVVEQCPDVIFSD